MTRTAVRTATVVLFGFAGLALGTPAHAAMPPDPEQGDRVVVRAPSTDPGTDPWAFEITAGALVAGAALAAVGAVRRRRLPTVPWETGSSPASQREGRVEDGREVLSSTAGRAP